MDITGGGGGAVAPAGGTGSGSITILTQADSPYALKDTDEVLAFSLGANMIVNLPSGATRKGRCVKLIRLDFNGFTVAFNAFAGEGIDGQVAWNWHGIGASYYGAELIAVGNDGIGFINGWHVQHSAANVLELQAGPTISPKVPLIKLGTYPRSIQPYAKGFYAASTRTVVAPAAADQLQSYDTVTLYDTTLGALAANLNGASGLGQFHWVRNIGTTPGNNLVLTAIGGALINGGATLTLLSGQAASMVSDGVNWWTLGFAVPPVATVVGPFTTLAQLRAGFVALQAKLILQGILK